MPTYTFYNKKTKKEWTELMSIANKEKFLKENPNVEQRIVKAPAIGDPVRLGVRKVDNGFKEVLSKVNQAHPRGSTEGNLTGG